MHAMPWDCYLLHTMHTEGLPVFPNPISLGHYRYFFTIRHIAQGVKHNWKWRDSQCTRLVHVYRLWRQIQVIYLLVFEPLKFFWSSES